jgi:hypothetical protein
VLVIHRDRLCRQIHEAIQLSVPADLGLDVCDVLPGKSKGHYIVVFQPSDPQVSQEAFPAMQAALEEARGALVDGVAEEITRRSLPELTFRISPKLDWDALRD